MGKPLVGEVVVLPFPQTNLQSGKRRPALVVANLPGDDLVLCQITSQTRNDGGSVPLLIADFEKGRAGCGQLHPSATPLYRGAKRDSLRRRQNQKCQIVPKPGVRAMKLVGVSAV